MSVTSASDGIPRRMALNLEIGVKLGNCRVWRRTVGNTRGRNKLALTIAAPRTSSSSSSSRKCYFSRRHLPSSASHPPPPRLPPLRPSVRPPVTSSAEPVRGLRPRATARFRPSLPPSLPSSATCAPKTMPAEDGQTKRCNLSFTPQNRT